MQRMWIVCTMVVFLLALGVSACQSAPSKRSRRTPPPTSEQLAARLGLTEDSSRLNRGQESDLPRVYEPSRLDVMTLKGRPVNLSRYQGQWLLIDFFTTYADLSAYHAPQLKELYDQYKSRGFTVVGVSLDMQGRLMTEAFVESFDLDYDVYLAAGETRESKTPWGYITEIPAKLLIDPKGRLVEAYSGNVDFKELNKKLDKTLPKP